MVTPVVVMGTRGDLRKTRYPFFYFIRAIIIPSSPAGSRLGMCEIQTIDLLICLFTRILYRNASFLSYIIFPLFFCSFFFFSSYLLLYYSIFCFLLFEWSISHIVRSGKNVTLDMISSRVESVVTDDKIHVASFTCVRAYENVSRKDVCFTLSLDWLSCIWLLSRVRLELYVISLRKLSSRVN